MREHLEERKGLLLAAGIVTAALVAAAATPQLLWPQVSESVSRLGDAEPAWLWACALLVGISLVTSAQAWRRVVRAVGGTTGPVDASARYVVGSAVNSLLPARLGDAVRIALFSRLVPHQRRLWTTAGVYTTIGAARSLWCAVLLVAGVALGAIPLWVAAIFASLVAAAVAAAAIARGRGGDSPLAHFFDSYRELGRNPRGAAPILAWTAAAAASRVVAAAALLAALDVEHALAASLLIVPTLDAASLVPLTPGALSISSGAIVLSLQSLGISPMQALTVGIALHAVEAAVGLGLGLLGALVLAGEQRPVARRLAAIGGAGAAIAVAAAFGVTVL